MYYQVGAKAEAAARAELESSISSKPGAKVAVYK